PGSSSATPTGPPAGGRGSDPRPALDRPTNRRPRREAARRNRPRRGRIIPSDMRRWVAAALAIVIALAAGAVVVGRGAPPARALPVAADDVSYQLCGRVFPDPHAYWPLPAPLPTESPWAKGNLLCRALDYLGHDETIAGLRYLESLVPRF